MDWDGARDDTMLMNQASSCANSDSCTLEEAQTLLDNVLRKVQKECDDDDGGNGNGNNAISCDNVDLLSSVEIVANLRSKIEQQQQQIIMKRTDGLVPLWSNDQGTITQLFNVLLSLYIVSSIFHGGVAMMMHSSSSTIVSPLPLPLPLVIDDVTSTSGVVPFLPQEFIWAVRDGYFPLLVKEWMTHGGGLSVVDVSSMFDEKIVPFTLQEWTWSIRYGYFGDMVRENLFRGGAGGYGYGYVVDSTYASETSPMTAQDLIWSYQGGYLGTAVNHFFRNGGV
jgi:hypothetical protein